MMMLMLRKGRRKGSEGMEELEEGEEEERQEEDGGMGMTTLGHCCAVL